MIEIEDARLGPLQRCVMGRPDSTCLPEVPSFVGANEEEKGGIEDADGGDVYLVEPARRKDGLERDQDEESEEVERRTIGEECVGLTPSKVSTARRNWISALLLATICEKVFESMETRIVRKSVLPRKAKVTMRTGPRMR